MMNNNNSGSENWKWFPTTKNDWSFDVVGLLTIIGESAMEEHAQTITASLLGTLPRIIPAPQALLKPGRPKRLPATAARVTGIYNGINLESVSFFANIITPLEDLEPHAFKVFKITHTDEHVDTSPDLATEHTLMSRLRQSFSSSHPRRRKHAAIAKPNNDEEKAPQRQTGSQTPGQPSQRDDESIPPLQPRRSFKETARDLLVNPSGTLAVSRERPIVPAKLFSPIHILSVVSFILSIAIIIAAVFWKDGVAIVSVVLLSIVSSVVGFASSWRPILMIRSHTNEVPKGDLVIRTRVGAFVIVKCTEEVARELYSGTEECEYRVNGHTYRVLMAFGTILLMLSVIVVGNCQWNSQVFIGGSYVILNGLYWALGLLPRKAFWDLSRYTCEEVTPPDSSRAHEDTDPDDEREGHASFTRTLWYAIRETKRIGWVQLNGAAPRTQQWENWLREAEENASKGNHSWPAVGRKNELLRERDHDGHVPDEATQQAPVTTVGR